MRLRVAYLVAAVAVLLGAAGLARGVVATGPAAGAARTPPPGVTSGSITVSGAYVREPASPDTAAAYLSITNSGTRPDTLESIYTGAAKKAELQDVPGAAPATGGGQAADEHRASGPLTIPPGATITLSPGKGHIMLESPTGPLRPGDRINLALTFTVAGQVLVGAPVVAIEAATPTPGSTG